MKETAINSTAVKQAGAKVTDMSARIRAMSGEAQARASNDQLTGTNLGAAAERAANALAKTRTILTNRFDQHAQALTEAAKALEEQDANAAQHLRKAKVGRYGPTIK